MLQFFADRASFDGKVLTCLMPPIFTSQFNAFARQGSTQAWSLVLTLGRSDACLGTNPIVGRCITTACLGAIAAGAFETLLFAG